MMKLSEIQRELCDPRYAYPIARIAREIGENYHRVYKALRGLNSPQYELVEKLSDWLEPKLNPECKNEKS